MSDTTIQDMVRLARVRRMLGDGSARCIREASGLSTIEVAEALGTTSASVSRWERGIRSPRLDVGLKYLRLLNDLQFAEDLYGEGSTG